MGNRKKRYLTFICGLRACKVSANFTIWEKIFATGKVHEKMSQIFCILLHMSGNWFAIFVFSITIGTVWLFSVYDWGYGVLRGMLLLVLGLFLLSMQFFRRLTFSSDGMLRWAVLAVVVLFNLFYGIRTLEVVRSTRYLGFDQAQMSYHAAKFLISKVNPYGQNSIVDPLVYNLAIARYQNRTECIKYSPQRMIASFSAFWDRPGGSAEGMEMFFPVIAADKKCEDIRRAFGSLGYPYGPVTIATYMPLVLAFEESGLFVAHLLLMGILAVLLFWIGWNLTRRGNAILACLPPLLVLLTPIFRHNFLGLAASDLPAVLFATVFVALWLKGRYELAALALALSLGSKIAPGLLFLPLIIRSPLRMGLTMVIVLAVFYMPFLLWDAEGLKNTFLVTMVNRSTDSTSLIHFISPSAALILKMTVLSALAVLVIWVTRRGWTGIRAFRYLAFAHIGFLFVAPSIHNNYLTWLLPVLGLALICEIYSNKRSQNSKKFKEEDAD